MNKTIKYLLFVAIVGLSIIGYAWFHQTKFLKNLAVSLTGKENNGAIEVSYLRMPFKSKVTVYNVDLDALAKYKKLDMEVALFSNELYIKAVPADDKELFCKIDPSLKLKTKKAIVFSKAINNPYDLFSQLKNIKFKFEQCKYSDMEIAEHELELKLSDGESNIVIADLDYHLGDINYQDRKILDKAEFKGKVHARVKTTQDTKFSLDLAKLHVDELELKLGEAEIKVKGNADTENTKANIKFEIKHLAYWADNMIQELSVRKLFDELFSGIVGPENIHKEKIEFDIKIVSPTEAHIGNMTAEQLLFFIFSASEILNKEQPNSEELIVDEEVITSK